MNVSAYIPCFNNAATLAAAIASIQAQSLPVAELLVIDDGSTDGSATLAESLGVRVLRHPVNLGRGAARARAMEESLYDLVLSCDATNVLEPEFLAKAIHWFSDPNVAAVFGRLVSAQNETVVNRWRSRHLFKCDGVQPLNRQAPLMTGGTLLRKKFCAAVGGYPPALRHSEDADLGQRLLAAGYEVIFDPCLTLTSTVNNTLGQVLERYWRWYAGKEETVSVRGYLKQISYSLKVMARQDMAARDPLCVPISLLTPHYQFWKSLGRKLNRAFVNTP